MMPLWGRNCPLLALAALACLSPAGDGPVCSRLALFSPLFCERAWQCLESESKVTQSCPTLQPHGLLSTRLLCPWDFPGKNTGVGYHFLLQEIFPTQELNPGLPHCRQMLYRLSHQGSTYARGIAIPQTGLLSQVSSLRLPLGHSGLVPYPNQRSLHLPIQSPLASGRCERLHCFSVGSGC